MNQYTNLAKLTLSHYLKTGEKNDLPKDLDNELISNKAGVFVSLKNQGKLRGCIGTFLPTQDNIAMEIINNTISAATQDFRFSPVLLDELDDLDISVDVLSSPEKANKNELDCKKYGIIVESGNKKGLLLPDLEGVDTVEEQINIACQKADIYPDVEKYEIKRFTVKRYGSK